MLAPLAIWVVGADAVIQTVGFPKSVFCQTLELLTNHDQPVATITSVTTKVSL